MVAAPPAEPLAAATPSAAPDPTAAAFFDVDNTVIRGASIFVLARGLWRRDFFGLRDIAAMAWKQARFIAVGENLEHLDQIREQALAWVAGHSVAELTAIGEEVYDEAMAGQVWPGTRALAMGHLERGQEVWLVTATPVEVAAGHRPPARPVRRPRHGGRERRRRLHRPPGRASRCTGGQGERPSRRSRSDKGLDLSRCAAYSDSANDIPMLSLVGHPCAVNPDAALLRARPRARLAGRGLPPGPPGRASSACAPQPPRPSPARSPPRPTAAEADAPQGPSASGRRPGGSVRRRPSGAASAARRASAGSSRGPGR